MRIINGLTIGIFSFICYIFFLFNYYKFGFGLMLLGVILVLNEDKVNNSKELAGVEE